MIINRAITEPKPGTKHTGFPCPMCHVITVRQPFASLIALGFTNYGYRSRHCYHRGAVVIHAGANWYKPKGLRYGLPLRSLILEHFARYTSDPEQALDALFPLGMPVADAVVTDCQSHGNDYFAIGTFETASYAAAIWEMLLFFFSSGLRSIFWE